MCATMLVETVNVSTLTVRASEESTAVSAITQDSDLKEAVENGEAADKAAYDAAQAAQNAAAAAEDAKDAAVNLGKQQQMLSWLVPLRKLLRIRLLLRH